MNCIQCNKCVSGNYCGECGYPTHKLLSTISNPQDLIDEHNQRIKFKKTGFLGLLEDAGAITIEKANKMRSDLAPLIKSMQEMQEELYILETLKDMKKEIEYLHLDIEQGELSYDDGQKCFDELKDIINEAINDSDISQEQGQELFDVIENKL